MTASSPRTIPIVATTIVLLAIATMIGLGIWQLGRKAEKEAQLAQLAANRNLPAITFPMLGPFNSDYHFRKSSVTCISVAGWRIEAGKASDGNTGFRYIAECATGAEGPGALVVIGVGDKPDLKPKWTGGTVAGWIVAQREEDGVIARLLQQDLPNGVLLVADQGQSGLKTPAVPNVDSVPNNHLAYAVQWFLFAAIAGVIYTILLWRRRATPPRP